MYIQIFIHLPVVVVIQCRPTISNCILTRANGDSLIQDIPDDRLYHTKEDLSTISSLSLLSILLKCYLFVLSFCFIFSNICIRLRFTT